VDVNDFISVGIFEEKVHLSLPWCADSHHHVIVHHEHSSGAEVIFSGSVYSRSLQVGLVQTMRLGWFPTVGFRRANGFDFVGIINMVKVGIDSGKAFGTDQFFFVQAAIRLAKLGVSFGRYLPQSEIIGHDIGFIEMLNYHF
jgi:hypothetical protein